MEEKALVFDTSAIIKYFENSPEVPDLRALIRENICFVSLITRMELLGYPGITAQEEQDALDFLSEIDILPISDEIVRETVAIRRRTKLKLPDAIIAATAVVLGAEVVTTDEHFHKCVYPGLMVRQMV
jgi:predicted nucleic acid-binding protein